MPRILSVEEIYTSCKFMSLEKNTGLDVFSICDDISAKNIPSILFVGSSDYPKHWNFQESVILGYL